jgi:benzodiazapine receptor
MHPARAFLFWRWFALIAVLANAVINFASARLNRDVPSIAEVSANYHALFTPAPYAFAIWGLIYVGLLGYAIFALQPAQRVITTHDSIARLLVIYAVLGVVWVEAFRRGAIGLSVVIILAMFVVGAFMFGLAKRRVWSGDWPALAGAPFSLYFGWISVATIADGAAWVDSRGGFSAFGGEIGWTILLIVAAVVLAVIVSRRYRDSVYPGVFVWAVFAIWLAQRDVTPRVAYAALIGAIVTAIWTMGNGAWIRRNPVPAGAPGNYLF